MRKHWFTVVALGSICAALAPGQKSGPRPVTLDVVVTDKAGKPVSGLLEQDFTVLDNKRPQKLSSFRAVEGAAADLPVKLILVIDQINDSFVNVSKEREQVAQFLRANGGKLPLPTSLVFISDTGTPTETVASLDGNAVAARLAKDRNSQRASQAEMENAAYERLTMSMHVLEQLVQAEAGRPGRKLVVWISPGWSLLSSQDVNLTDKVRQQVFHYMVEFSTNLRLTGMTLYNVDPLRTADSSTSFLYREFLKGANSSKQVQYGNVALQVIATQSGGQVLSTSNDLVAEIAKCVADAQAFYVLEFPGVSADAATEYHAIDVKLDKPGLAARTNFGYYALPAKQARP
jgi:VWFA-related protein